MNPSVLFCVAFITAFSELQARYQCTVITLCSCFATVLSRGDYFKSGRLMNMTVAEMFAVTLYSFDMIYRYLNEDLRLGNLESVGGYVNLLSSALSKHNGYDTVAPVYRGMMTTPDFARHADPNVVVIFQGFTSTTPDVNIAQNFAGGAGVDSCMLIFTAVGGCEISKLCWVEGEQEILFPPGLMFTVTSSTMVNGVRHVELRQVFSTTEFDVVIHS
jgi:hypothetical protein